MLAINQTSRLEICTRFASKPDWHCKWWSLDRLQCDIVILSQVYACPKCHHENNRRRVKRPADNYARSACQLSKVCRSATLLQHMGLLLIRTYVQTLLEHSADQTSSSIGWHGRNNGESDRYHWEINKSRSILLNVPYQSANYCPVSTRPIETQRIHDCYVRIWSIWVRGYSGWFLHEPAAWNAWNQSD